MLKVINGICLHGIIVGIVFSSIKWGGGSGEDRIFTFLHWFIPVYSGIVTDTTFFTLGINSLKSLDVQGHTKNMHMNFFIVE